MKERGFPVISVAVSMWGVVSRDGVVSECAVCCLIVIVVCCCKAVDVDVCVS